MRPLLRGISGFLFLLALAFPWSVDAQESRAVSGVVVDAETGQPVSDAVVTIQGTGRSVTTDSEGRFEVSGVPFGQHQLVLTHLAYGEHAEALEVEASGSLDFEIRVTSRAIELAPLGVEVMSREETERRAYAAASHVIDRGEIDRSPRGQGLFPVLQSRVPGLRVEGACIEYRDYRQIKYEDPANPEIVYLTRCRDITVYVDGVPNREGSFLLSQLSPSDVERIEVVPAAEASLRYMEGSRGVILVETRQGSTATSPYRIHVNGFGWYEEESYPWIEVLGVSTLAGVAAVGLASTSIFDCSGFGNSLTPPRCHAAAGMGTGLLTSAVARVISQRVGRTSYSEGRTYPALLMGAVTASLGYVLYVHGEKSGSSSARTAGQVVLAAGIPISLTFSDRVFRMLR